MKDGIRVVAFTDGGARLGARLREALGEDCAAYAPPKYAAAHGLAALEQPVGEWAAAHFSTARALVFVGASGIAVRAVAPLLVSKGSDPAVLCIDEAGTFVIPLLSGHIGGANGLAKRIAGILGGTAVLTTATDVRGRFSPDAWAARAGCVIPRLEQIKAVSAALLDGEEVGLSSEFPVEGPLPDGVVSGAGCACGMHIALREAPVFRHTLWIAPKILRLGVGCRKGVGADVLERRVRAVLEENAFPFEAVRAVGTISLKAEEPAILALCGRYGFELCVYTPEQLMRVTDSAARSAFVEKITGVDNVCERAALASGGGLLVGKTAGDGVTVAVAAPEWRIKF